MHNAVSGVLPPCQIGLHLNAVAHRKYAYIIDTPVVYLKKFLKIWKWSRNIHLELLFQKTTTTATVRWIESGSIGTATIEPPVGGISAHFAGICVL
jgi:hypothetical protein